MRSNTEQTKPGNSVLLRLLAGFAVPGLFLISVSASGQSYVWNNVVIKGGGFVSGLITHPHAAGVVYARTDIGGVYRWDAAGNSWIPLLDFGVDANTYGIEMLRD